MISKSSFPKWLGLAAACAVMSLLLTSSVQAQQHLLTRHVREVVVNGQAPLVGVPPGTQQLQLAVMLPLRNQAALSDLLRRLYDPQSPLYHQYLSTQQFTDRFGPTQADYDAVVHFAEANGMTVTRTTSTRMVLDVTAAVADINRVFHVTVGTYKHPSEHRTFYAVDREPSLDLGLQLWHISGLDDFSLPQPMLRYRKTGETVKSEQTGSGPGGQFLGSDMRAAYYGGTALTGAGQSIGLFEFQTYNVSDVQLYFSSVGQPLNVPIANVLLDGVVENCGANCSGDGETANDIVQAISMAPGASAVIVYGGNSDVDIFNQMATDNIAKQMSVSYGWLPPDNTIDDPIFQEFAAQGQNLFVASGDSGAYDPVVNPTYYPADDPYITAAGGTQLTTNGAGGPWQSEIGWGGDNMQCGGPGTGSGGGIGTDYFAIPNYQELLGVINASNQGSTTYRNVPDVASNADCNNYWVSGGSVMGGLGGTSLSAPKWAGFMALVNEQVANNNAPPVGFLNPLIYAISTGSNYDSDFHDITVGANPNVGGGTYTSYSDVFGYDLVTGWGSPNGQNLINALTPASSSPYFVLSASPATLTKGESSTITLTAGHGFSGTVNLSANVLGSPAGVTATLSPTSITDAGTSTLSVSTTSSAPGGNLTLVVTGTSASGVLTQPAYLTLELPDFSLSAAPSTIYLNQGGTAASTITVTPQNGFDGTVTLSPVKGLPSGVTASFSPAKTKTMSTLTLTARSTTLTGLGVPLTVTGRSGNLTQNVSSVNVALSAAIGTDGAGTPVDLSSAYNRKGIYTNGIRFTEGLDGLGYAYSSNLLTANRILNGVQFNFGPANQLDAVDAVGQTITLPGDQFSTLQLLATGVLSAPSEQTITVTYTDGTSSRFKQSFSNWFSPSYNDGESFAVVMPYANYKGAQSPGPVSLYGYIFVLDSGKTVRSLTLPNNRDVVVLAATLTTQSLRTQMQVSLSSAYDLAGIYENGVTFPATGGMDHGGDECTLPNGCADGYSAQQLGLPSTISPKRIINGVRFDFGPVNTTDCTTACVSDEVTLRGAGVTIALPSGQQNAYTTMAMLGTAVDGSHTGTVTVAYTTGPPQKISQTFSDWCSFGSNANESIALGSIYRINSDGTLSTGVSCNLYAYTYALDSTRAVQSIKLTNTDGSHEAFVLAITLLQQ